MPSDGPENSQGEYEVRKAKYEATRAKTDLWRDWISLGILVVTAFTGIGTIFAGVATGTTQVLLAGVAVLSGTSGTAIVGLTRGRAPGDGGHDPPP